MKNSFIEKVKSIDTDWIVICKAYLAGILGALTVSVILHWYEAKPTSIGTVNVTGIVNNFVKNESKKNLSQDILKNEIKNFGLILESEIKKISNEKKITLFISEAVVSGSKDYTKLVRDRMEKRLHSEEAPNDE